MINLYATIKAKQYGTEERCVTLDKVKKVILDFKEVSLFVLPKRILLDLSDNEILELVRSRPHPKDANVPTTPIAALELGDPRLGSPLVRRLRVEIVAHHRINVSPISTFDHGVRPLRGPLIVGAGESSSSVASVDGFDVSPSPAGESITEVRLPQRSSVLLSNILLVGIA